MGSAGASDGPDTSLCLWSPGGSSVAATQSLLAPFGIRRFYTDGWGAYHRHLAPYQHVVGKRATQQLERKHLTLRTRIKRLVRKTICFSKSIQMHDLLIGLFINRLEFGLAV